MPTDPNAKMPPWMQKKVGSSNTDKDAARTEAAKKRLAMMSASKAKKPVK